MGLESVKEEIIRNAQEQASDLDAEARKEVNRINKEIEEKIRQIKDESEAQTEKMLDPIKKQELATIKLEAKKMLLEAKKNLIEKIFVEAKRKLGELNGKERESYIKKLLEKIRNDIEPAYIYCNKNDVKLLKGVKGIEVNPANISGGLIAENKDKTIRVDYSFDTMVDSIKEKELQTINNILFG